MTVNYFECKRRIERLSAFRVNLVKLPTDPSKAPSDLRRVINEELPTIRAYMIDAGFYPGLTVERTQAAGGRVYPDIDPLGNLFVADAEIGLMQIVVDAVDRTMGWYKAELRPSSRRTFNPFWWLWRLVALMVSSPFRLMTWAGFDGAKFESSPGGRGLKFILATVFWLAGLFAALVTILDSPTAARWVSHLHR